EPRLSMERYATRVERSKGFQLDISINGKAFAKSAIANVEAIMGLIGPHVERWRSLRIDHVPFRHIRMLCDHLEGRSLSLLESLRVVESSGGFRDLKRPECESLGQLGFNAPKLKELELTGVVAAFDSPVFHNLDSLYLTDDTYPRFRPAAANELIRQLLQQSPDLKRFYAKCALPDPILSIRRRFPLPLDENPVSYPFLTDLALDFRGSTYDAFLPSASFPALRSFRTGGKAGITLDGWHFPLLARNSPFPALKKISLTGDPYDPEYDHQLGDALSGLASLEHLELRSFSTTQLADALQILGYSCPQLRGLALSRCTRVDLDKVRSLVDTRLRVDGMTPLRKLRVYRGIYLDFQELVDTRTWFKERVEDVTLFTHDGWV
ncbi:hypothetical protein FRC01_010964, partial [Tulasnella sp. 417]